VAELPLTVGLRRSRRRWPIALAAVGLLAAVLAAALLARTLQYRHETMPGVRLLGADVGGRGGASLEQRIAGIAGARLALPVTVLVGRKTLSVRPDRLLAVNMDATADAAMRAGQGSFFTRAGTLLSPVTRHREVALVLRIRRVAAGAFLVELRKLGRPPVDASVGLDGLRPVVKPAQAGTTPLGNRFLAAFERQVLAGGQTVAVRFRPQAPRIATLAARVAAADAATFVSAPVTLRYRGNAVVTLSPASLASLLRFRKEGTGYAVSFDEQALAQAVEPSVKRLETEPKDASFAIAGKLARVIAAEPGRKLDPAATAFALVGAARAPAARREAAIAFHAVQPSLTTQKARALGIREQLVSFTTQLGASSANRIHNVHLMADYIDGTLIRSGETFSFNNVVGPRTTERGFLEGQQIIGSLTLPSIGGGVCQTATTLFNDAFEAGLPILARINHGYYLSHYPLGRDATVSWGGPDLVFRNDLKHAILIKSSYTDATLTFTFFSTPQGRTVTSTTGPQTNWTDPKLAYALDPSAPRGSVRTVAGSGERGFDVDVSRTVTQDGKTIREDSFHSHYIPVGDTAIYGPGRSIPGPYFVIPPSSE
jgi:vancomycin resistance protein YoaR